MSADEKEARTSSTNEDQTKEGATMQREELRQQQQRNTLVRSHKIAFDDENEGDANAPTTTTRGSAGDESHSAPNTPNSINNNTSGFPAPRFKRPRTAGSLGGRETVSPNCNGDKLVAEHSARSRIGNKEDQLSLAAIHYLRNHYQEATDIYKQLLLQHRDDLALNVYVAMCYYKLDYYDVSLEILAVYLQAHPDSVIAINLKACNHFRLYNGKAAEAELKALSEQGHTMHDNDLIRHNLVVFRNGENALKVLPGLVDFLPEARLNLVIYHLRNDDIDEAYELIKDIEPGTPQEYILKGVVNASIGQSKGSREHLKKAQQFFQLVGASASECDTIPGRQCMASCFFLLKQFEDVNIYLNSIKAYLYNDDDFNYNYGLSLCNTGQYREAEDTLQLVQDEKIRSSFEFLSHLARAQIRGSKRAEQAWELYLKMDSGTDSFALLELIANDCYKVGEFYYAAKAASTLYRLEGDAHTMWWEALRGAACGVLAKVASGDYETKYLGEVVKMLKNISNPQVEYIVRVINKFAKERRIDLN